MRINGVKLLALSCFPVVWGGNPQWLREGSRMQVKNLTTSEAS